MSLIMPVWRPRREWLMEAVHSALGQEGVDLELIVVDDGGPTPVAPFLDEIDDPRLRTIRAEHGGPGPARSLGAAHARGDHLRFIDADDAFHPRSTRGLLELAQREGGAIAYGATVYCDEQLRPQRKLVESKSGWIAVDCLLGRFRVMLPSLLFPRSTVESAGGWDPSLRVSEDWDFVLRCCELAPVVGNHSTATYYRRSAGSASSATQAGWEGAQRVVEKYFSRHPEQRTRSMNRKVEAMLGVLAARQATAGRPWRDARFWRAAPLDPRAIGYELTQLARRRFERLRGHRPPDHPPPPPASRRATSSAKSPKEPSAG